MANDITNRTLPCGCKQTTRYSACQLLIGDTPAPSDWKLIQACSEHGHPWRTKQVAADDYEGYLIRARPYTETEDPAKPYVLDVEVYECFNHKPFDAKDTAERVIHYQKRDSSSHPDYEPDINNAEKYISGSIRWDGCSNLNFGDNSYMHFCGKKQACMLGTIMAGIYELAAEMIDLDIAMLE